MTDYVFDIETTMDHKTIRCGVINECATFPRYATLIDASDYMESLLKLGEDDKLIMHNGTGFDIPVLKDVYKVDILKMQQEQGFEIVDTLTIARLLFPDILGGNSLDAWGKRMSSDTEGHKGVILDYDTEDIAKLIEYCKQDCKVTYELHLHLQAELASSKGNYSHPIKVEQKVQDIVNRQVRDKVQFDVRGANDLYVHLVAAMRKKEKELDKILPRLPIPESKLDYPPKKQFVKSGELSASMVKYLIRNKASYIKEHKQISYERTRYNLPLTVPLVTTMQLKPSNNKEIKNWLLFGGWQPTYWNYKKTATGEKVKTSPKLSENGEPDPALLDVGFTAGIDLTEWLMMRHRKNCIKTSTGAGWLNKIDEDGCIPSEANPLGTPTGRFRHKTIANVPRVSSPYGKELRSLFRAREGKVWVGWDASSLEACMEAHYTFPFDGGEYADKLLLGDVHQENADKLGLTRDQAKTFKYAVTYGASADKLASQFGWSSTLARDKFNEFWLSNPALAKLKFELEREWTKYGKSCIVGLDGRMITTRSKHSLLNSKLQGAGAVVMKHSMLLADKRILEVFPDAKGLIRYHDEEIWECEEHQADSVGEIGVQSIIDAGKFLKLHVALDAEYKVGANWGECH